MKRKAYSIQNNSGLEPFEGLNHDKMQAGNQSPREDVLDAQSYIKPTRKRNKLEIHLPAINFPRSPNQMKKAPEANGDLGIVLNRNNSNPNDIAAAAHPMKNARFE